jgi:hypothetical protein
VVPPSAASSSAVTWGRVEIRYLFPHGQAFASRVREETYSDLTGAVPEGYGTEAMGAASDAIIIQFIVVKR